MAMDKTTIKVLNKLFEHGYRTEKAILNFSLEDIQKIECYAPSEIAALIGLKEAVKGNKVISYLSGGEENNYGAYKSSCALYIGQLFVIK